MKRLIELSILITILTGTQTASAQGGRFLVPSTAGPESLQPVCATLGCAVLEGDRSRAREGYFAGASTALDYLGGLRGLPGVVRVQAPMPALFGTTNVIVRTSLGADGLRLLCLIHA